MHSSDDSSASARPSDLASAEGACPVVGGVDDTDDADLDGYVYDDSDSGPDAVTSGDDAWGPYVPDLSDGAKARFMSGCREAALDHPLLLAWLGRAGPIPRRVAELITSSGAGEASYLVEADQTLLKAGVAIPPAMVIYEVRHLEQWEDSYTALRTTDRASAERAIELYNADPERGSRFASLWCELVFLSPRPSPPARFFQWARYALAVVYTLVRPAQSATATERSAVDATGSVVETAAE